jgi:hypothetical protein
MEVTGGMQQRVCCEFAVASLGLERWRIGCEHIQQVGAVPAGGSAEPVPLPWSTPQRHLAAMADDAPAVREEDVLPAHLSREQVARPGAIGGHGLPWRIDALGLDVLREGSGATQENVALVLSDHREPSEVTLPEHVGLVQRVARRG